MTVQIELLKALKAAYRHLEWCGYGDKYERECAWAAKLDKQIEKAIHRAENNP